MPELPRSIRVALAGGYCVSLAALFWIFDLLPRRQTGLWRVGWLSAVLVVCAAVLGCWSAFFAAAGKSRGWSLRTCTAVGMLAFLPTIFFYRFMGDALLHAAVPLLSMSVFSGLICRKLAFPHLTEEDVSAAMNPPPPTMFPK
ncbi:MAG: hypothetical protein WA875_01880 [Candidatus Acidiferrales bacterium]